MKHRERCLRRSIDVVKEILREREDQAMSFGAESPQQDGAAAIADSQFRASPRPLSPSPSSAPSVSSPLQRRSETNTITNLLLVADEDEVDRLSYSSHSDQRETPPSQGEGISSECDGDGFPRDGSKVLPPLCALSVFRAPDMLAFEDYLHRSRRLPTRLGFPDLLPSPDKWHDWSWGQLRAPVYVVPKHPEDIEAAAGAGPPHPSHGDVIFGVLQPEVQNLSDPLRKTP